MDDERKGRPWIAGCSGAIVLLGLYVGAYALTVETFYTLRSGGCIPVYLVPGRPDLSWPHPDLVEALFSPVHRIDRHVRRRKWDSNIVLDAALLDGIPWP